MQKSSDREIGLKEPCPCESGKQYGNCCKKKNFTWVHSEDDYARIVPLSEEAKQALENAENAFVSIFERKPRGTDPLFLGKYLFSEEDFRRDIAEAMERSETDPAIVYAYRKTGLLFTEETTNLIPDVDIEEWDAAIDQYYDELENPPKQSEAELEIESLIQELDNCLITFGYLLEHGGISKKKQIKIDRSLQPGYAMICATNSFKTLRSIKFLLDKDVSDDCFMLVRHIFENYLHIVFSKAHPEKLEDLIIAVAGLMDGTHEYKKTKSGRADSRTIIEIETGREFEGHISNYRMAASSEYEIDIDVFSYFYELFSRHSHPNINTAHLITENSRTYDFKFNSLHDEVILYAIIFSCLVLDEIRLLPTINNKVALDVLTVVSRVSTKAINVIRKYTNSELTHLQLLNERLSMVGVRKRS